LHFQANQGEKKKKVCENPFQWEKAGLGGKLLPSQQQCETYARRITVQLSLSKKKTLSLK
jgi:hypothetical protein